jgi:hypothetical protein
VPVKDLKADLAIIKTAYLRTLGVAGATAKLDVVAPFTVGRLSGVLDGRDTARAATGFGDPRIRFSVLFKGAPALSRKEFAAYRPGTIVGGSLQFWLPLGQYNPAKRLNLGSNRFAFRPQLGVSQTVSHWVLEATAAAWIYTNNTDYLGGKTLSQEPIVALQGHVAYVFRPGLWASVDGAYGHGGRRSVNGEETDSVNRDWRFGLTLALPVSSRDSIKFAVITGLSSGRGADYSTILGAYQYRW